MNSATRRVMLLDRAPGQAAPEFKSVRGVRMEVGESFVSEKRSKLDGKAKLPGREFTSRRLADGRFRIWRTA